LAIIVINRLHEEVKKEDFSCGKESIDNMVYEAYFTSLLQFSNAYKAVCDNETVGYFMTSLGSIRLDFAPESIAQYAGKKDTISTLYIDFIAVKKELHGCGFGKAIMKIIEKKAETLIKQYEWNVRLITFNATKDNVDKYISWGFQQYGKEDVYTVPMFKDLWMDQNRNCLMKYMEGMV